MTPEELAQWLSDNIDKEFGMPSFWHAMTPEDRRPWLLTARQLQKKQNAIKEGELYVAFFHGKNDMKDYQFKEWVDDLLDKSHFLKDGEDK